MLALGRWHWVAGTGSLALGRWHQLHRNPTESVVEPDERPNGSALELTTADRRRRNGRTEERRRILSHAADRVGVFEIYCLVAGYYGP